MNIPIAKTTTAEDITASHNFILSPFSKPSLFALGLFGVL
jgi:hypothetical protein